MRVIWLGNGTPTLLSRHRKRRRRKPDWRGFGELKKQKQQRLQALTEQSSEQGFNPLRNRSQRALERSSRLAEMESERKRLQERLSALEAESESLNGQISKREREWQTLTELCRDYESAAVDLERDLKMLRYE